MYLFEPIMQKTVEAYNPEVIVLQCGADTLTGDPVDAFNLTLKGKIFL